MHPNGSRKNLYGHWFIAIMTLITLASCSNDNNFNGHVRSGDQGVGPMSVSVLASSGTNTYPLLLTTAQTDANGDFTFHFDPPSDPNTIVYLIAEHETQPITLAAVLKNPIMTSEVVLNERTTVATAFTLAQFIQKNNIVGASPGPQNAAAISQNLVNVETGDIGGVLGSYPNGGSTSTLATFNSLANLLASCVQSDDGCSTLFALTQAPQGDVPVNTFQAALNIARYPWQNVTDLFDLSQEAVVYQPALTSDAELTAWTLALRYNGNGKEFNGPGNIVFDEGGSAWICNNYVFQEDPLDPEGNVCGGEQLIRLTPTGEDAPGAPYEGGGLYGVGFGITFDPHGNLWLGNFGFQGSNCPYSVDELSRTVSKFNSEGVALSPNSQGNENGQNHGGFPGAGNTIRRPQGTVSDQQGNIWIANCSGDSLTQFPGGDPNLAFEIAPLKDGDPLLQKPFAIGIDPQGNGWVSSNENSSVFAFNAEGNLIYELSEDDAAAAGVMHPMGIVSDSRGNIWVANSGIIRPPCESEDDPSLFEAADESNQAGFSGENASVTLISADKSVHSSFKGGGLILPWGIAVDGNDNVWVANFGQQRVSQLCGARPETCPPGFVTGQPISPDEGYHSDGLVRNTGVSIDPSGNVWLTNNWKTHPDLQNPGGNEVVVFIGLAKPVKAPLIGPAQGI